MKLESSIFRKLLFKSDKNKFSFRSVEREDLQSSRKRSVVEHSASVEF